MRYFVFILSVLGFAESGMINAAAPPEAWNLGPVAPGEVAASLAAVEHKSAALPTILHPTMDFQKVLLRIEANEPASSWRADVEKFAHATGEEPVTKALRELALCWEARARMQEIDAALRKFYRTAVRFPDKLEEVKGEIPADAKTDPWGESWIYKPAAPHGFSDLTKQRYELAPARYPKLSTLREFINKPQLPITWKIAPRNAGGTKAVEIKTTDGQVAAVQPGGRVADATLAYVGDGWALFANTERLFAVGF